ncbi:MAG: glycosyltransferase family 2 protein [Bacteroidota bacterium]
MNITVVIPCYRVRDSVLSVIKRMPDLVSTIICVDDACPQQSGKLVEEECTDDRVFVMYHEQNKGVGGAMKSGYKKALELDSDIVVKVDGDGQIPPERIPDIVKPIQEGKGDYVKGNRFYSIEALSSMPSVRLMGNSALSFVNKIISGYWNIMDPTNGFTAISRSALELIPIDKLADDYFFESDMLFRLNTIRAVIKDIPMKAEYVDHNSSLSVVKTLLTFPHRYLGRFLKRIFYTYYLRDFNLGSLTLSVGVLLTTFGTIAGIHFWYQSITTQIPATSGSVMLAALPVIMGIQSLLSFLHFDVQNIPDHPLTEPR